MNQMRALAVAAVIPWIPTVPPTPLSPTPAAPCAAAALHAELELQGATGSLGGGVVLMNQGTATCSLRGTASAQFIGGDDPAGVKLKLLAHKPDDRGIDALAPGESAFVQIWWSNWCGTPLPSGLHLTLGGREFDVQIGGPYVPTGASARCDSPSTPSTLAVGSVQPRDEPPSAATRLPLTARIVEELAGVKRVPGVHGRVGHTAVFQIALTNTSTRPYRFGAACPTYSEQAGFGTRQRQYVLNCRSVGVIGSKQTVVFEMHVRVPADAERGKIPLTWMLAPTTYEPPFAGGVILVD